MILLFVILLVILFFRMLANAWRIPANGKLQELSRRLSKAIREKIPNRNDIEYILLNQSYCKVGCRSKPQNSWDIITYKDLFNAESYMITDDGHKKGAWKMKKLAKHLIADMSLTGFVYTLNSETDAYDSPTRKITYVDYNNRLVTETLKEYYDSYSVLITRRNSAGESPEHKQAKPQGSITV